MTEEGFQVHSLTSKLNVNLFRMYSLLSEELSRTDKCFDVEFNGFMFKFNPACTIEEKLEQNQLRKKLITELMHEAIISMLNTIHDEEEFDGIDHWKYVKALVSGEDPRNHQFEIIKEEIVSNLDEDGKPITAKPLNHDSVYVQWQDENKFKFEEKDV